MFNKWLKSRQARAELVRSDAASLMERFGDLAYSESIKRVEDAERNVVLDGNRPAGHWSRVKSEIGRRTGRDGLDTATRYLIDN